LIDVSPLYKYLVHGPDAARLLDRVMTRAISSCAKGKSTPCWGKTELARPL